MGTDSIIRSKLISKIGDKDRIVLQHLGNLNDVSTEELQAINNELPDVVMPEKVGLLSLNTTCIYNNYIQELKSNFNAVEVDKDAVVGKFDINGAIYQCDIFIRRVTAALLVTGYSSDDKLSAAVEKLFINIITIVTADREYLTTKQFIAKLLPDGTDEYRDNLIQGIKDLAEEV